MHMCEPYGVRLESDDGGKIVCGRQDNSTRRPGRSELARTSPIGFVSTMAAVSARDAIASRERENTHADDTPSRRASERFGSPCGAQWPLATRPPDSPLGTRGVIGAAAGRGAVAGETHSAAHA